MKKLVGELFENHEVRRGKPSLSDERRGSGQLRLSFGISEQKPWMSKATPSNSEQIAKLGKFLHSMARRERTTTRRRRHRADLDNNCRVQSFLFVFTQNFPGLWIPRTEGDNFFFLPHCQEGQGVFLFSCQKSEQSTNPKVLPELVLCSALEN